MATQQLLTDVTSDEIPTLDGCKIPTACVHCGRPISVYPSRKRDRNYGCRVRPCINPWHTEPVTRSVNIARGYEARRAS